jgi:5-(carboxyamino)imidazole ribonucleotide synthase
MVNVIGRMPRSGVLLGLPGVHLHDYGKTPRPGRKLGHLTCICATEAERAGAARALRRRLVLAL